MENKSLLFKPIQIRRCGIFANDTTLRQRSNDIEFHKGYCTAFNSIYHGSRTCLNRKDCLKRSTSSDKNQSYQV